MLRQDGAWQWGVGGRAGPTWLEEEGKGPWRQGAGGSRMVSVLRSDVTLVGGFQWEQDRVMFGEAGLRDGRGGLVSWGSPPGAAPGVLVGGPSAAARKAGAGCSCLDIETT